MMARVTQTNTCLGPLQIALCQVTRTTGVKRRRTDLIQPGEHLECKIHYGTTPLCSTIEKY